MLLRAVLYNITHLNSVRDIDGYVPELYEKIRWPLLVFQTAAILEVMSVIMLLCDV